MMIQERRGRPYTAQTLPLCLIQPSSSGNTSPTHVLLYPVPSSPRWPSLTVWTHTPTHIRFLHKLLFPILSMCPNHLNVFLFTHSTTPQFTPCAWLVALVRSAKGNQHSHLERVLSGSPLLQYSSKTQPLPTHQNIKDWSHSNPDLNPTEKLWLPMKDWQVKDVS